MLGDLPHELPARPGASGDVDQVGLFGCQHLANVAIGPESVSGGERIAAGGDGRAAGDDLGIIDVFVGVDVHLGATGAADHRHLVAEYLGPPLQLVGMGPDLRPYQDSIRRRLRI